MLHYWNSKERIPVNRVRAMEQVQELQKEFSKREWRDAINRARARWLADGNVIERVAPQSSRQRGGWRGRGGYID